MKIKERIIKILIVTAIIIIGGVLYKINKESYKVEIKEWNNIYNENNIKFFYGESSDPKIKQLSEVYKTKELVASEETELNKVLKIVDIVNSIVEFDDVLISKKTNAFDILQEKAEHKKVSQRDMSIITRDLLLSTDIKARSGEFKGLNKNTAEGESYYVVEYWSEEYNKWVMLDFKDRGYIEKNNIPCSAIEIISSFDKEMKYIGKKNSKDYIKDLKKILDTYTINIDNSIGMEKSNSYIEFVKDKKYINIKFNNKYLPPTVFTENEGLFNKSPNESEIGTDENSYIILMKKENNKVDSESNAESFIVGGFKNGRIINSYYIRQNDSELKKVEKYEDIELIDGENIIEISEDGSNILSYINIKYDKNKKN